MRERFHCFSVAAVTALICLSGYYQGYMTMIAMGIYVTIRVLIYESASLKERILAWFEIGLAMGFGVLMGAINLLPSLGSLSVTSRMNSGGERVASSPQIMLRLRKGASRSRIPARGALCGRHIRGALCRIKRITCRMRHRKPLPLI